VLAAGLIRDNLHAHLAPARVGEQPPSPTPTPLPVRTRSSSAWIAWPETIGSRGEARVARGARFDVRHGASAHRVGAVACLNAGSQQIRRKGWPAWPRPALCLWRQRGRAQCGAGAYALRVGGSAPHDTPRSSSRSHSGWRRMGAAACVMAEAGGAVEDSRRDEDPRSGGPTDSDLARRLTAHHCTTRCARQSYAALALGGLRPP
jgi:hypothetical protein